jgi:DNA-directed RNA polymerase specialized sigma24 family protein
LFTTALPQQTQTRSSLPYDLFEAIAALKKELNAVILAHYYQDPDIQDVADYLAIPLDFPNKLLAQTLMLSSLLVSTSWQKPPKSSTLTN